MAQSLTGRETPGLAGMWPHAAGPLRSTRELGTKVNGPLLHPGHRSQGRLQPLSSTTFLPALNPTEHLLPTSRRGAKSARGDKGKLKNEKTRLPRRHSHRHTCLSSHLGSPRAVPTAPTVLGCCYSRWPSSPQSAAATARPAQPRQAWQEQQHPSLCSPHAAPERLLHPQNQLSFHPWALAIHFTKSGGQKDRAESVIRLAEVEGDTRAT